MNTKKLLTAPITPSVKSRYTVVELETDAFSAASDPLFVTALSRGLDVLRCCAKSDPAPTINEVAKRLGLPQATSWRLCHTLIKLGYLERTEQDRLRPGLPVLELGQAALIKSPLSQLSRSKMEDIARKFKGSVSLGVPDGLEILYLQRYEGGPTMFHGLRAGSRVSMLASAMGWSYIAGIPTAKRNILLKKLKNATPDDYARISQQLKDALARFASSRFIVNAGVLHPEVNALAVTIGHMSVAPVACLSFGGPRSTFPIQMLEKEIRPALVDLADSLTVAVSAGVKTTLLG